MKRGLQAEIARSPHWGEVLRLGEDRAVMACRHCGCRVIVPLGRLRPTEWVKDEKAGW